ncbi:MAG: TSUP family transporter [Candidatus Cloacimonetes bacterium]|nr:TSUP family transporter [Candidatus Cloacimonadota bacterium]
MKDISMYEIIILIVIGLFSGILSGVLGIGGGLVIVPALVFFLKITQHEAQGTTLALMLPPITLLSTYAYYKAGHLNLKVIVFVSIGFFIGGLFGGKIAVAINAFMLKKIFAVLLIAVALNMLLSKK